MRSRAFVLLLGVCVAACCALPSAVWAQQQPRNRVRSEQGNEVPLGLRFADLKLGPAYLQPRVAINNLGYDTNVLGSPTDLAVSDFRVTPSAGTRLVIPIRTEHQILGDAQVDYLWFAETVELRTFNAYLDARYQYDSDRWQADLYTRYANAQRSQLDVISIGDEIIPPSFEVFGTTRRRDLDVGASVRVNIGTRLVVEPRGLRRIVRYLDDDQAGIILSETLDRTEESVGGFIGWRLTSRVTAGVDGNYQFNDYEAPNNPREADVFLVAGRVEFEESGPLFGTFVGGYRELRPTEEGFVGYEGFAFDADLSFTPGGVAKVTLQGDKDVYPSFWFDNVYFLRQGAGTIILFQAQRAFAYGAELSYHEHEYPVEATAPQQDGTSLTARRLDKIGRFLGRIEWRQTDSRTLTFRIGWIDRSSNFDVGNSEGFVISGGYAATF